MSSSSASKPLLRNGVSPSKVGVPAKTDTTALEFLAHRFPAISREVWLQRFLEGSVFNALGRKLGPEHCLLDETHLLYFRHVADEPALPFKANVIYRDDYLVVADKPHFMPVTPGGQYVQQSLLVQLKQQLNLPQNTKYVCFGWGNKEFFFNVPEWKDLTFGLAFRALFFRLESAMHVISYREKKESWLMVKVANSQQNRLNAFIQNSFVQKENNLLLCKKNQNGNNCFYDAEGRYSCVNTCNVWVNEALKEANVKTSIWSPFHWGVLHHLEN